MQTAIFLFDWFDELFFLFVFIGFLMIFIDLIDF